MKILVFTDKIKVKPCRLKYQSYMVSFTTFEKWLVTKKKMRENQSHIKLKNQNNYNIKKGKKYVCCKKRFNEIRIFKLASYDVS